SWWRRRRETCSRSPTASPCSSSGTSCGRAGGRTSTTPAWPRPTSAGSGRPPRDASCHRYRRYPAVSVTRSRGSLILQLDHDLVERLRAGVDRGLDAAPLGPQHVAGRDVALDVAVRAPRPTGVGLE